MKKGCVLMVAGWAVLVAAYGFVAWSRIHLFFPTAAIAVLGGTFAGAFLSSIVGLFTGAGDRRAIERGLSLAPLRDGRLEAVSGPIRPTSAPLEAPFSGKPCVAFEYDVKRSTGAQSDVAGVALAPCVIDSSRGSVRVLGWTILDQFPTTDISDEDLTRGEAYLHSETFERTSVIGLLSAFSEMLADDDGAIRKDMRLPGAQQTLADRLIEERVVPVGEVVTLMGRWSQDRQGFTPAGSTILNRLFPGDLAAVRSRTAGEPWRNLGLAAFLFLALHAILVPMYLFAPNKTATELAGGSVWDERDCDRQKTLLDAGADPNERGHDGTTPLMNAARYGFEACVQNLIAAGARLNDVDPSGETALAQAIRAERTEVIAILQKAGAKEHP